MNEHLARVTDVVETAMGTMPSVQLVRRRGAKWSVAEIVEHIARACSGTARLLEWCLDKNTANDLEPSDRQRTIADYVFRHEHLPAGLPAPPFAVPQKMEPESVLPFLRQTLDRLDAAVSRCERAFGVEATLGKHPVLGPLTGKQWCHFHWVHARHHVKQIEELREWIVREAIIQ